MIGLHERAGRASHWGSLAIVAALVFVILPSAPLARPSRLAEPDPRIAQRVLQLTRATPWTLREAIKLPFRTFHPQGMVRIGEDFYVSSVEIRTLPKRLDPPQGGQDRDAGAGVGHLFKIGPDGRLLADLVLGEGAAYHPGGIDFDGASIWVPVSEYRPDSRAIVYKVDPATMTAKEVFRFADHIGGVAFDRQAQVLHGISWGSRRFYAWPIGAGGKIANAAIDPKALGKPNPEQYIDYQDCHSVGAHRMLCSGLGEYAAGAAQPLFQLGGLDLVDTVEGRPVWQVPITLRSPTGRSMSQNPFFMEATQTGLRAYFIPDDDQSTLFVFDAAVP